MSEAEYDYVIVGAGSAGCVLADRLTEDGSTRVLVLEYGGSDRSLFIQMPAALVDPDEHADLQLGLLKRAGAPSRRPAHATARAARCIGGSSSINGLVYVRGTCARFRALGGGGRARAGATREVLPYFRRAESCAGAATRGAAATARSRRRYGRRTNPLYRRLHRGRPTGRLSGERTTSTAAGRRASAGST